MKLIKVLKFLLVSWVKLTPSHKASSLFTGLLSAKGIFNHFLNNKHNFNYLKQSGHRGIVQKWKI